MRDDRRCAAKARAKAWILSAEAWFALGEDPSARYNAGEAFKLDPLAKPDGQVPAVLADPIEDQRKLQVGDTRAAAGSDRDARPIYRLRFTRVYVPSGKQPLIEVRMNGQWRTLTPRARPWIRRSASTALRCRAV